MFLRQCLPLLSLVLAQFAMADVRMSAIFGNSMVVQRDKPIQIWGWTDAESRVMVSMADQKVSGKANADGRFDIFLKALPAGGPHELIVKAGDTTRTIKDVLVGEVWICSGQSNMAMSVDRANDPDLETLTANFPNIRLISVPQVGTQEPQDTFKGEWAACTSESVKNFSAVGYFFGRQLHQTLNVPIGLVDNAWGGSAAEAWISRENLEQAGDYAELLQRWDETAKNYDHKAAVDSYKKRLAKWNETKKGNKPRAPRNQLTGNHRPANIYNGVLKPTIGYTVRGAIWYQGESNSSRAYQYRKLFPLMIQSWRDEWKQGDFPFYFVQLADYRPEVDKPQGSDWAELREAQTMTLSALPNTGEAVILDLGEAADIHPKNKQDVGKRLARWALANDYGYKIPFRSPTFETMEVKGGQAVLTFEYIGGGLDTFDVREPIGFAIAGEDQTFVDAQAKIVGKNKVQVWSDTVEKPVAVRYAWADNPICNVQSKEGLPMTPFRTDQWKGVTEGKVK